MSKKSKGDSFCGGLGAFGVSCTLLVVFRVRILWSLSGGSVPLRLAFGSRKRGYINGYFVKNNKGNSEKKLGENVRRGD